MENSEFEQKYRELYEATVRFVVSRLGPDGAEDVAMTAWAKALTHLGQLDHPDNFRRWLFGILVNEVRLHIRSQSRSKVDRSASVEECPASESDCPEPTSEMWEEYHILQEIAEDLRQRHPEEQSELVLILWHVDENLTRREIAALIGLEDTPADWSKAARKENKVIAAIEERGYDRDQLQQILTYLRSPLGRAWAMVNTASCQSIIRMGQEIKSIGVEAYLRGRGVEDVPRFLAWLRSPEARLSPEERLERARQETLKPKSELFLAAQERVKEIESRAIKTAESMRAAEDALED